MRILQLSTLDAVGGAERVAMNLHRGFIGAGHDCVTAVGEKRSSDPTVYRIDNDASRSSWSRSLLRLGSLISERVPGKRFPGQVRGLVGYRIGQPSRWLSNLLGHEDFDMPGSRRVIEDCGLLPDVVVCHNLHGSYFDLRALSTLSHRVPVFLTLHDMWLLTGHCAYSLGCERWRAGCGHCPDLSIYPAIRRDATAYNWRRKRAIFGASRLHVTAPSRWLLDKALGSSLGEGVTSARLIPYGVDQEIFRPADRVAARRHLDLPLDAQILLFTAAAGTSSPFKDYQTLEAAVGRLGRAQFDREVLFLVVGGASGVSQLGGARVQFVPYLSEQRDLARYYQAADLFLHAAREDNFPNVVLEALSCGTPVVATGVGGVPEQIESGVTGVVTPPGNPRALADAVEFLLRDPCRLRSLGPAAAAAARHRFALSRHIEDYLTWFREVLAHRGVAGAVHG